MSIVEKESFGSAKGLHLGGKRSPFGVQKDYIWEAKGVHLEGKRSPFGKPMQNLNNQGVLILPYNHHRPVQRLS